GSGRSNQDQTPPASTRRCGACPSDGSRVVTAAAWQRLGLAAPAPPPIAGRARAIVLPLAARRAAAARRPLQSWRATPVQECRNRDRATLHQGPPNRWTFRQRSRLPIPDYNLVSVQQA